MPITRALRAPWRTAALDLGALTAAERLFLWRHRQKTTSGRLLGQCGARMSQTEAAAALGIELAAYRNLELGHTTAMTLDGAETLLAQLGPLRPTIGELCFIARRRSGVTLIELERELGVSRPTLHAMERAGDPRVVATWEAWGYIFLRRVF